METKKNSSQTIILISAALLLIAFVLIIIQIVPKISELKDLSGKIKAKENELNVGKEKVASIKQAIQLLSTAKKDIDLLGVAMPRGADPENAFVQLSSMASKSSLTVAGFDISQENTSEKSTELNVVMTVRGSFDNIILFAEQLNKNLRPTSIKNYTVSKTGENSEIGASFNLSLPYVPDPELQNQKTTKVSGEENINE